MAFCLLGKGINSINALTTDSYKESVCEYGKNMFGLRLGYVPGIIRHYFHGTKQNRKYTERWAILVNNKYDPYLHVTKNEIGLLVPTKDCPKKLLEEIYQYFIERNEDD